MVMSFLPKYVAKSSVSLVIFLDSLASKYAAVSPRIHHCLSLLSQLPSTWAVVLLEKALVAVVATGWITRCQGHYKALLI